MGRPCGFLSFFLSIFLSSKVVWEGEAGFGSAGRAGRAEGLAGASQEEEQRRFPSATSDKFPCQTSPLPSSAPCVVTPTPPSKYLQPCIRPHLLSSAATWCHLVIEGFSCFIQFALTFSWARRRYKEKLPLSLQQDYTHQHWCLFWFRRPKPMCFITGLHAYSCCWLSCVAAPCLWVMQRSSTRLPFVFVFIERGFIFFFFIW